MLLGGWMCFVQKLGNPYAAEGHALNLPCNVFIEKLATPFSLDAFRIYSFNDNVANYDQCYVMQYNVHSNLRLIDGLIKAKEKCSCETLILS